MIGFATFALLFIFIRPFLGPSLCADGWASGSIGHRGACSHHGGVSGPKGGTLLFVFAAAAGIAVGLMLQRRAKRNIKTESLDKNFVVNLVLQQSSNAGTTESIPATGSEKASSRRHFRMTYLNEKGELSDREFDLLSIRTSADNKLLLMTFCRLRRQLRTFRVDRIKYLIDLESGEIVPRPDTYFGSTQKKKFSRKSKS